MSRKRLLNILIPPKVQIEVLYEEMNHRLRVEMTRERSNFDWHRYVFFTPYGGINQQVEKYKEGLIKADDVRHCIAYHRLLRSKFTTRLP